MPAVGVGSGDWFGSLAFLLIKDETSRHAPKQPTEPREFRNLLGSHKPSSLFLAGFRKPDELLNTSFAKEDVLGLFSRARSVRCDHTSKSQESSCDRAALKPYREVTAVKRDLKAAHRYFAER
ncbi:hypothetical protein [Congregicoccus parvus]|uniref:hypothetical protein n=1 Tax=Congregicoccus parvus TaxID=3081749 RepID=UPI003FA59C4B